MNTKVLQQPIAKLVRGWNLVFRLQFLAGEELTQGQILQIYSGLKNWTRKWVKAKPGPTGPVSGSHRWTGRNPTGDFQKEPIRTLLSYLYLYTKYPCPSVLKQKG